jgi:hypothetical protein
VHVGETEPSQQQTRPDGAWGAGAGAGAGAATGDGAERGDGEGAATCGTTFTGRGDGVDDVRGAAGAVGSGAGEAARAPRSSDIVVGFARSLSPRSPPLTHPRAIAPKPRARTRRRWWMLTCASIAAELGAVERDVEPASTPPRTAHRRSREAPRRITPQGRGAPPRGRSRRAACWAGRIAADPALAKRWQELCADARRYFLQSRSPAQRHGVITRALGACAARS